LADNDITDAELAELISYDSVLSAKLLSLANGPQFPGPPVHSISSAIVKVGATQLRELLESTTATNAFAKVASEIVAMDNYWHHSVCCALACESLAQRLEIESPQRLFVAGLLHDMGQLVIYQVIPDLATEVLRKAGAQESHRYRMEKEIIGLTHAQVGQELLRRWELPLMIQKVVEFHHEPRLAGEFVMEASIAHIATAVSNCIEPSWKTGNEEYDANRQISPFAWHITGLSPDVIDATISEVSIKSVNVLNVVDPESAMIF
jgi:putative nucleotidyltransferase with HDIG domain